MAYLAILADDLTGAADAGAAFASTGLRTSIVFTGEPPEDIDVLILSTNSRDADATTAAEANRRAAHTLSHMPASRRPRLVYKKLDSALRGHPREELLGIVAELGEGKALIAPALPAEGRLTIRGRQVIHGTVLEPGSADGSTDLVALFDRGGTVHVQALDLNIIRRGSEATERSLKRLPSGLLIADAETDNDLSTVAHGALATNLRLLAGSAGLARQLAEMLALPRAPQMTAMPAGNREPVLIVAGSRHRATEAQVKRLRDAGLPIIRPTQAVLDEPAASILPTARELSTNLAAGRSVVLTTAGLATSRCDAESVVSRLAEIVAESSGQSLIGGLVLTGGAVAAGVLTKVGARELHLMGEIRPAMPWGILHSSRLPIMPVATKAGSFGADDALLACYRRLRSGIDRESS